MLAFAFLVVVLGLIFAFAELAFRALRLSRRLSRWRSLALFAGSTAGAAGILYAAHFLL